MIDLYAGFDEREEVGFHAFASSVIHRAKLPVAIHPLHLGMFRAFYEEKHGDGRNAFIYTRFLIPYLQQFTGWAIFADGADMVCLADIAELWELRDHYKAVQVVKHNYQTKHPRKYVGTQMEADNLDYPRKNWSSVMLINCGHFAWRNMTPDRVMSMSGADLHKFAWIEEARIGSMPVEWNWIADEMGENAQAKIVHWTAGIPGFPSYANAPMADEWVKAAGNITHATP